MGPLGKPPPHGPVRGSWGRRVRAILIVLLLLPLAASACQQADRILEALPRVVGRAVDSPEPGEPVDASRPQPTVELPPAQPTEGFDFEPLDDDAGNRRFLVRLRDGGSPALVAGQKLTPLFEVDGKNAAQYVSDAYFQANPGRTPQTMQPGDEFVLTLPADAFLVRRQEEQTIDLQGPTRVLDYVSERGDRLRTYLDQRVPIEYALEPADGSGLASLRFSPDLAYLLGAGRLTPIGLARLVYQVPDPDLYQVMEMRRLAESVKPGQSAEMTVDRTRKYLDPVREAMTQAITIEPVLDEGHDHLERAVFGAEQGLPYFAVEDALSDRADISDLPPGQVFRVEYGRDGVVRVSYLTGDDDRRGRRDPYKLRETERWGALYDRLLPGRDSPIAWGPGEPSDLDPFPTARDPNRRVQEGERSYDYLVAGRAIVLTFRPTRSKADALAEAELHDALRKLRDEYHDDLTQALDLLGSLRR
jgi:hypothetical protein